MALAAIVGLAALLDFLKLSQNGYANTYYAGAVRSMLKSWHNFFFAAFDPGGLVSVDKPPLALWVETASAKLFGYSGFSILLPEALAGVVAVWVLYLLVTRVFGRVAGLVAALALAVSPVSVSVNRDNNPDALFVLLLVLAVYVGVRALESGRLRTLLLSAALVGLAFNTKMLAAMVVVPGLGLAYLLCAPQSWRKRLGFLAAATVVLVVVSGAWIAAVDLTPAADRPYVGSTTDNSALSLALDYNGLGRVTGQTGGTSFGGGLGGAFSGSPGVFRLLNQALGDQGGWLLALAIVGGLSALLAARRRRELGALVAVGGWFVAAAAVFSLSSGIIHTYYLSALAPATSALVGIGTVALWRDARRGSWWLALPVAAIALSAWLEVALLRRSDYLPWLQGLALVTAVAACASLLGAALPRFARLRAALCAASLAVALAGLLAAPTAWSATTLKQAVNGVFPGAGPDFVSGLGTTRTAVGFAGGGPGRGAFGPPQGGAGFGPRGGTLAPQGGTVAPPAGTGSFRTVPGLNGGGGPAGGRGFAGGPGGASDITAALAYAKAHGPGTRWALIVSSEQEAASAVIRGESVAAMGGFTGRETVLTNAYLARLVRSGEARYFVLGGQRLVAATAKPAAAEPRTATGRLGRASPGPTGLAFGPGGGNNAAVSTITSTCKQVTTSSISSGTLYDCAGKADAIAAAG